MTQSGQNVWLMGGAGRGMGADIATAGQKMKDLQAQLNAERDLTTSLAREEA